MLDFFLYFGLVVFITWVIRSVKLFTHLENFLLEKTKIIGPIFKEIRKCKLCLGFYPAFFLYFVFGKEILPESIFSPILNPLIVALLIDYMAYYFSDGVLRNHGITTV